jgi:hypothetical protein
MRNTIFLFLLGFSLLAYNGNAQGCSDAGFCTIGAFKPEVNPTGKGEKQHKHRITFLTPIGQGDDDVLVWTPGLQYDYFTSNGWNFQGKLTGNYADGSLGSAYGAGDIYLSASKANPIKNNWQISYTLGFKIPLNAANASNEGMPLPMQYQSSLGTFDLIAGATIGNDKWQFSTGYQQPLTGANKNGFLPEYWNGKPEADAYPPSFMLERKGDILLRASRSFQSKGSFSFNAGLLGIIHLGEDIYTNPFEGNMMLPITGSSGLTLNITGAAYWQLGTNIRVGLTGGIPMVVRDVRPDGLTRSWVLSPEISWTF